METNTHKPWLEEIEVQYILKCKSLKKCNGLLKPGWFSMILVISGSVDIKTGTSIVHAGSSQLYVIPCSSKFCRIPTSVTFYLVACSIGFALNNKISKIGAGYTEAIIGQSNIVFLLTKSEKGQMTALVRLLQKKLSKGEVLIFQQEMVQLCLNLILYEYSALCYKAGKNIFIVHGHKEKIVMTFIELVKENAQKYHHLKFYADSLFVTNGHLSKIVRTVTGMPPKHFIEMAIIGLAYSLLADDKLTISEIGESLNFSTTSSFSGFFKKYAKLSPTQYRSSLLF